MNSPPDIETIKALLSGDERERNIAADELGDVIEYHPRTSLELQSILDALGSALEAESSDLVMESILNAISNAKYHRQTLKIPLDIVRRKLPFCKGSAVEHAAYILEGI